MEHPVGLKPKTLYETPQAALAEFLGALVLCASGNTEDIYDDGEDIEW